MVAESIDSRAKTSLPELAAWVREIAELTKPDESSGATARRRSGTS